MKRKSFIAIIASLAMSCALFANGTQETKATTDANSVIKFKLGLNDPNTSNYYKGAMAIAENVEKETNGRIKISVYPSGQLGNEREMVEGAMMNTIDMWTSANSVLTNFVPKMGVLDCAFLFDNTAQAHAAVDGPLGDLIDKAIYDKLNMHIVGWMESGFRNTFSTKPIQTIEDFHGIKIRTMENKYHMAAFNSFGAIATPMAYGDVFPALQQGTIDACENADANCLASGFYEVTKNITDTQHAFVYIVVGMSPAAWDKIPEDLRPAFLKGVEEGCKQQRQFLVDANKEAKSELVKKGVTFHHIDHQSLVDAYAPQKAEFMKTFDPEWVKYVEQAINENK